MIPCSTNVSMDPYAQWLSSTSVNDAVSPACAMGENEAHRSTVSIITRIANLVSVLISLYSFVYVIVSDNFIFYHTDFLHVTPWHDRQEQPRVCTGCTGCTVHRLPPQEEQNHRPLAAS